MTLIFQDLIWKVRLAGNSSWGQGGGSLMYSGDITSAPLGAVEYLYASNKLRLPTLVKNNVFCGSPTCNYRIIVGKGDRVSNKFMMNPDNLFAYVDCKSVQKQNHLRDVLARRGPTSLHYTKLRCRTV